MRWMRPRRVPDEGDLDVVDAGHGRTARAASARRMSPMPQPGAVMDMSISIRRVPSAPSISSQR